MRRLFVSSTFLFWLAVCAFWVASVVLPPAPDTRAVAADRSYTLAEVGRHVTKDDCWMAIEGQVYDLTGYVPQHPSDPAVFLPWCGKEATQAYRTKTKGRPHSPYADQLLPQYRIGVLSEPR
jgi:cytochrome b involved in lipid metabolism